MNPAARFLPHELSAGAIKAVERISLFNSPKFLSIWETLGGKGVYWCNRTNGGFSSLLAGVEYGSGRLTRFQSMPDGLYTSPFSLHANGWTQPKTQEMTFLLEAIAKQGYCKIRLYDYMNCLPVLPQFSCRDLFTFVVDISSPIWEPPDATLRSEIRKAEREDIQVELFDETKHWEPFLSLMEQTERRHGRKPKYPSTFFYALAKLAEHDSRVIWKYCAHEGKPAASHIFFVEDMYALHWQVYFDKEFSWLKPNQYILFTTIRELQARGIHTISLGASPVDAAGLLSYKEKWGGEIWKYRGFSRFSWLGRLL